MTVDDLLAMRAWADTRVAAVAGRPGEWHSLMRLREALDAVIVEASRPAADGSGRLLRRLQAIRASSGAP